MSKEPTQKTNRLSQESSPYLLQHASNPVDWNPWGEEALAAAREQDKPILLSIGYSACHWCHVMEHESFENEEIAQVMNDEFINIKVDREERPDLDAIYMNFVQMTTGSGGWPLTVFLTPDLVPFYGGTYFPPDDRYGRPGFKRLIEQIKETYSLRRGEIQKGEAETIRRLQEASQWSIAAEVIQETVLDDAYNGSRQQFDAHHGGFGGAPKFPSAMVLASLLRYSKRRDSASALDIAKLTLNEMARGGIYDQLGGGFHRYSVDERWLIPHFEKMLYDNALLARVYLEAHQLTGNPFYRTVVEETLDYVGREMRHPAGGFYSAQDADSEGEEGKFYAWTPDETLEVLGEEDATIFNDYFDVTLAGNFEGSNVLHPRLELDAHARNVGIAPAQLTDLLTRARKKLFQVRETRVKPGLDDKVLASWNGLMLTAFAEAAFTLDRPDYLEIAVSNAEFLSTQMVARNRLFRTWKDGSAKLNGYLEDYATVVEGWIATYQATGDIRWLDEAAKLTEVQIRLFWDPESGDFYFTPSDHERLLVRHKEYMDNATPSGNAVACFNLLRLAKILGKQDYHEKAEHMLSRVSRALSRHPLAFGYWLQALDFYLGPVQEFALVGPQKEQEQLLPAIRERYLPNKVLASSETVDHALGRKVPLLAGKTALEGKATAYVCRDYACQKPVTTRAELEELLTAPE